MVMTVMTHEHRIWIYWNSLNGGSLDPVDPQIQSGRLNHILKYSVFDD